jgi:hypothetical protein
MIVLPVSRVVEICRSLFQRLGLAFMFLGVFLERPAMFASSILLLVIATPLGQLGRRLISFKVELLIIIGLISVQAAANSQLNALILVLYLMGLINGLLLPNPRTIPPRSWILLTLLMTTLALFFTSDFPARIGLTANESIFGTNTDDYEIDYRSLAYAWFILFVYLAPHFHGELRSIFHVLLLIGSAMLGTNKFGIFYAALYKLSLRLVIPAVLILLCGLAAMGFSLMGWTAAREGLWSDFFANFPTCNSTYGVCTELIGLNNEEGVRSFHSIVLDFGWYGGILGLIGGMYFLVRVASVRSNFGASAGVLFSVALLFGFPPFFNERHILIVYALLLLFQTDRTRRLTHRPLRAHRPILVSR